MEYELISSDSHIDLRWMPHDVFVSNAPSRWRDQVPHVRETEHGKRWFAGGMDLVELEDVGNFASVASIESPPRGTSHRVDRMHDAGFFDGRLHSSTPDLRLKDQDLDGVDAEVIYPILGVGWLLKDQELRTVVYQIYNTWVADFCKVNSDRLVPLACIPNHDPQVSAAEVRRAASLGLRGCEFDASKAVKPVWHRDWDALWAAVEECNMPISFHSTGVIPREPSDDQMAKDYWKIFNATRLAIFQLGGAECLTTIIYSGALDRYPGMKFVLGECGASWIPYVLARLDEEYNDMLSHLNYSLKPSEFWRRHGYTTFQHETILADLVNFVGENNVMWGSDYPHADGVWPDSRKSIEADLGRLEEGARSKITCKNAGKLYGLIR